MEEHAVQPAVGDRATGGDGQALGSGPPGEDVVDAVPAHPRPQLGELVGGIATRQHVQHPVELGARQLGEWRRGPHRGEQASSAPAVHGGHRHDLLGQHVEGVAWVAGLFDGPVVHPAHHHGALHEVPAELGEDLADARGADLVAGTPDPLQAAGDRPRGLDLHDEVDRAHVDAELQGGGGDDAAQPARLEV